MNKPLECVHRKGWERQRERERRGKRTEFGFGSQFDCWVKIITVLKQGNNYYWICNSMQFFTNVWRAIVYDCDCMRVCVPVLCVCVGVGVHWDGYIKFMKISQRAKSQKRKQIEALELTNCSCKQPEVWGHFFHLSSGWRQSLTIFIRFIWARADRNAGQAGEREVEK